MTKKKNGKKNFPFIAIIVASLVTFTALTLLVLVKGRKPKSNTATDSLEVQTEDFDEGKVDQTRENEQNLPESFPEGFPVYTDAFIDSSWSTDSGNISGTSVVWVTDDRPSQIFDYYKRELALAGFSYDTVEADESYTLSFEKQEISGFVGITEGEEGRTVISVTVGIRNMGEN